MTDTADAIREATLDILLGNRMELPPPHEVAARAGVLTSDVESFFASEPVALKFLLQPLITSMDNELKPLTIHRIPTPSQQREALTAALRACRAHPRQVRLLRSMLGDDQGVYRNQTVDAFSYQNGLRFVGTDRAKDPIYVRRVHFVAELVGAAFRSHRHDLDDPETFAALVDSCMGVLNPPTEQATDAPRNRYGPRGQR